VVYGVILIALGLKKTIAHSNDPLDDVSAVALCGGVAAYVAGLVAIRWRRHASIPWVPVGAIAATVVCLSIATGTDAVVTVTVLAAIGLVVAVTV
jgi:hypothetical protein